MTKKDVDVNELPSFSNIKDIGLRSRNRGAILANIYETYKKSKGDLLSALESYIGRFPKEEREGIEGYMLFHLKQRGYTIGS